MTSAAIIPFAQPMGATLRKQFMLLSGLLSGSKTSSAPAVSAEALRSRDPDAWRAFFEQEMPAIFRYAHARLGSPEESEDVASQVFEEAWRSIKTFKSQGLPPRAWLFGVARNVVAGYRRSFARRPPHLALEAVSVSTSDSGTRVELLDLARSVASLEASHAEVITLRFVHGLSLRETAGVLGTTVDSVKGRQARALALLKQSNSLDAESFERGSESGPERSRVS